MKLPFISNRFVGFMVALLLVAAIPLTIFLVQRQQELRQRAAGEQASFYFTTPNGTTPLVTVATDAGQSLTLNLFLDTGTNTINGFDVTVATTGDLTFSQLVEGPDAARFPTKVFGDITNAGHTLRFTKVNSSTSESASGKLLLGTITFTTLNTPSSGAIEVVKTIVTSPATSVSLAVFKPIVSYTILPTTAQQLPVTCDDISSTDTVLVIDRSSSMKGTKLDQAKEAAKSFVDAVSINPQNKVAVVSFTGEAKVNSPLTNNFASVKKAIDSISTGSSTCIACGITTANQEIVSHGTAGSKKAIILLTDGRANTPGDEQQAEQAALTSVENGNAQSGTVFYTIGLGKEINDIFLKQIATDTGGKFYFSPTSDQLLAIYNEISKFINKGSVTGFVFNDANNNRAFDFGEEKLSGWKITISGGDLSSPVTFITNSSGSYSIPGICSSPTSYTLTQEPQPNWTQTVPINPKTYTITITSNGEVFTDKSFGNINTPPPTGTLLSPTSQPGVTNAPTAPPGASPSPAPIISGHTVFNVSIILTGIGVDLPNYPANKNPAHPQKNVRIEVFDKANTKVSDVAGVINYAPGTGKFSGLVGLATLPTGLYNVKLTVPYYLRRLIPSIQTITGGATNQLLETTLIVGDINGDNVMNILDYNIYTACFGDKKSNISKPSNISCIAADLNDDGQNDNKLNLSDFKLLFQSFATQKGD